MLYEVITDNDLYMFIKYMKARGWKAGQEIGLISYNENPVKEILCDGISTISTNHDEIGKKAAEMILSRNFTHVKSPFEFIKRNSVITSYSIHYTKLYDTTNFPRDRNYRTFNFKTGGTFFLLFPQPSIHIV